MGKTLSEPVVILKKETKPDQSQDESRKSNLLHNKDSEAQDEFDDLGEIEDLYEIYGEMSNIL